MSKKYHMAPAKTLKLLRAERAHTLASLKMFYRSSRIGIESHWQRWQTWDVTPGPRDLIMGYVIVAGRIKLNEIDADIAIKEAK